MFKVSVTVYFYASANFTFYMYDALHEDYTDISGGEIGKEREQDLELVITLKGNYNEGYEALELDKIEISKGFDAINSGYLKFDGFYEE